MRGAWEEAGTVGDEERRRGDSGCEVGTYVRSLLPGVHLHLYVYGLFFSLCAEQERKQVPSATQQSRGGSGRKVVTYICTIYTPTCIYTGMDDLIFSVRGSKEEAATVVDEVEAAEAAKVVTYARR